MVTIMLCWESKMLMIGKKYKNTVNIKIASQNSAYCSTVTFREINVQCKSTGINTAFTSAPFDQKFVYSSSWDRARPQGFLNAPIKWNALLVLLWIIIKNGWSA